MPPLFDRELQLQLNSNTWQQLKFAQTDEILPKINELKQCLRMQAGTSFTSACVAVMWRIPPPNNSSSVEVSGTFCPVKIEDIFVCAVDADCEV